MRSFLFLISMSLVGHTLAQDTTLSFDNKTFTYQNQYKANELALALLNGQMSYPSTVFLDEKFALLTVVPGYLTPKDLSPILTYFGKNIHLKMKWDEFVKTPSEK